MGFSIKQHSPMSGLLEVQNINQAKLINVFIMSLCSPANFRCDKKSPIFTFPCANTPIKNRTCGTFIMLLMNQYIVSLKTNNHNHKMTSSDVLSQIHYHKTSTTTKNLKVCSSVALLRTIQDNSVTQPIKTRRVNKQFVISS